MFSLPTTRYSLRATQFTPTRRGYFLMVIARAKTILAKLESDDSSIELPSAATPKARPQKKISVKPTDDSQLNLL